MDPRRIYKILLILETDRIWRCMSSTSDNQSLCSSTTVFPHEQYSIYVVFASHETCFSSGIEEIKERKKRPDQRHSCPFDTEKSLPNIPQSCHLVINFFNSSLFLPLLSRILPCTIRQRVTIDRYEFLQNTQPV